MSFRHPCIGQRVAMFSLHKITLTYLFVFLFSPSLELATSSTLCKKANNHIFSFKETQRRTGSIKSVRIFRGFTALSHFKLAMASLHPCFYNTADEPEINEWEMVHHKIGTFLCRSWEHKSSSPPLGHSSHFVQTGWKTSCILLILSQCIFLIQMKVFYAVLLLNYHFSHLKISLPVAAITTEQELWWVSVFSWRILVG